MFGFSRLWPFFVRDQIARREFTAGDDDSITVASLISPGESRHYFLNS